MPRHSLDAFDLGICRLNEDFRLKIPLASDQTTLNDSRRAIKLRGDLAAIYRRDRVLYDEKLGQFRSAIGKAKLNPNNTALDRSERIYRLLIAVLARSSSVLNQTAHASTTSASCSRKPGRSEVVDKIPVRSRNQASRTSSPLLSQIDTPVHSFATATSTAQFSAGSSVARGGSSASDTSGYDSFASSNVDQVSRSVWHNLWPRVPLWICNDIEFPVAWEIVRASQHCHVDPLSLVKEDFEPLHELLNQDVLRNCLKINDAFREKTLPPLLRDVTWQTAMCQGDCRDHMIAYTANLVLDDIRVPHLSLLPPKLERYGNRLSRRFGDDRFLEVMIPDPQSLKEDRDPLQMWLLAESHHLLGRRWKPFYIKKSRKSRCRPTQGSALGQQHATRVGLEYITKVPIVFFCTAGNRFKPAPHPLFGSVSNAQTLAPASEACALNPRTNMSITALLAFSIGASELVDIPVPKFFARLALSFTSTVAASVLSLDQIVQRPSDLCDGGQVMNDGAGRLSPLLAERIARQLHLEDVPSAFQGRIGPAKGMWVVDYHEQLHESGLWIEIWPSQVKFVCNFKDPAHRTFEVKDWSKELRSAALNQQLIPLLVRDVSATGSSRAVSMKRTLVARLQDTIASEAKKYKEALKFPAGLLSLLYADAGPAGWQFLGGLPDGAEHRLVFLLQVGFNTRLRFLHNRLWDHVEQKLSAIDKMKIRVPCSTIAFMVPDFTASLEEGEVQLTFSTKFQVDGFSDTNVEEMDVLVARNPAHLDTDIQRVRAVSRPQLRKFKDVIIFSTKGRRPLADMLSGGDYDGDRAWVCWDQDIVQNFQNATLNQSLPPTEDLVDAGYLQREVTSFSGLPGEDLKAKCDQFLDRAFKFNLGNRDFLGQCTKFKERYCYWNEVSSNQELGDLLSALVDQAKSGTTMTQESWDRFRIERLKLRGSLRYEPADYEGETRESSKGHILDHLKFDVAAKTLYDTKTEVYNALEQVCQPQSFDEDLTKPLRHFERETAPFPASKVFSRHLEESLNSLFNAWGERIGDGGDRRSTEDEYSSQYREKVQRLHDSWIRIEPSAAAMRDCPELEYLLKRWEPDALLNSWQILKASYTFRLYYNRNERFVWNIAGRQLAYIKATILSSRREKGLHVMLPSIFELMKPNTKKIRAKMEESQNGREARWGRGPMEARPDDDGTDYITDLEDEDLLNAEW